MEVKTNIGTVSLEDFLEIKAVQSGFSTYEELYRSGYRIKGYESVTPESLTN